MKICSNSSNACMYGYQSMIYAAVRGCKVLNCSWGGATPYSVVKQSIVDYTIACDVAIVAAAGNMGNGITDRYCTFYPAGYFGVLGASSTNNNDEVNTNRYVIGTAMRIMAQGNNYSLTGNSGTRQLDE